MHSLPIWNHVIIMHHKTRIRWLNGKLNPGQITIKKHSFIWLAYHNMNWAQNEVKCYSFPPQLANQHCIYCRFMVSVALYCHCWPGVCCWLDNCGGETMLLHDVEQETNSRITCKLIRAILIYIYIKKILTSFPEVVKGDEKAAMHIIVLTIIPGGKIPLFHP